MTISITLLFILLTVAIYSAGVYSMTESEIKNMSENNKDIGDFNDGWL